MKADPTLRVDSRVTDSLETHSIREGSPFAEGSVLDVSGAPVLQTTHGAFAEQGPMQYTAVGSLISCLVVLAFAIPAAFWFPAGGVAITILGLGLAIFGIQSGRVKESIVLVAAQLVLFLYCIVASQN